MPDKPSPSSPWHRTTTETIPVIVESADISTRTVETGRVRVALSTETVATAVRETLHARHVVVDRVPVGRMLAEDEAPPGPREEGDTLVIPVVEETAVVVRRLVLREEVRLRLRTEEQPFETEVALRRQVATVERLPPAPHPQTPVPGRDDAMTRTITALFDSAEAAERAAYDLATKVGGVRGMIIRSGDDESLHALGLPQSDLATLREQARRGGVVFHAEVPEDRFDAVSDVLEAAGAQDFDEREESWRTEGWNADHSVAWRESVSGTTGSHAQTTATTTGAQRAGTAATGDEERIPVVEEQLTVSKREAEHGRVRIRSYVVERPVEEQVRLHEERVQVERRPVDRPVGSADEAAFRERTIEAVETREEPVVSKQARVVEEVVVRKQADDRTETVSDKVRRTEVEVEDERKTKGTPRDRR